MTAISKPPQHPPSCRLADQPERRNKRRLDAPLDGIRGAILALTIAAALSACGNVVVGPVNHSCLPYPERGLGSGCSGGGGGGR
jgi:hypothetical protein